MKYSGSIIIVILLLSCVVFAQETAAPDTVKTAAGIRIETEVDKAEVYIGDLISYRVAVIYDTALNVTPPPIGANLGSFDVKDYSAEEEQTLPDGTNKIETTFELTTFTTGDYIIPPIPVEFMTPDSAKKILLSEPVPIKVKSLLAESADTADIREIKGPIEFESVWPWWYYALAGVLLVVIAYFIYSFYRKKEEKPKQMPLDTRDPWEIAFEKLAYLREKNYIKANEYKAFYIELTEIVRDYLGRMYHIPVLDMTTFEFLTTIRQQDIDEPMFSRLKKFLEYADLVKFAKLIPEEGKMQRDFEEAREMVGDIRDAEKAKLPTEPNLERAGSAEDSNV